MNELLSLVVTVRPQAPTSLPGHLGRAVYAQLLRWLDAADPALAARWHDTDGPKPFTCSDLVGGRRGGPNSRSLSPERTAWFRLTSLDPAITAILNGLLAAPPPTVELDGVLFDVEGLTTDPAAHPWAGTTSYEVLAAPYLLARVEAPRQVMLDFSAPTAFKQNNLIVPLPLPDLVFGGLADRWNAFSPVAISPEVRRYCQTSVALKRFRLRSAAVPLKDQVPQIGGRGQATYVAAHYDRYWMGLLGLLADFAVYAGAGRLTSVGMGQARRTG